MYSSTVKASDLSLPWDGVSTREKAIRVPTVEGQKQMFPKYEAMGIRGEVAYGDFVARINVGVLGHDLSTTTAKEAFLKRLAAEWEVEHA